MNEGYPSDQAYIKGIPLIPGTGLRVDHYSGMPVKELLDILSGKVEVVADLRIAAGETVKKFANRVHGMHVVEGAFDEAGHMGGV